MKIVQFPHPSLRFKAQPLTTIDKEVRLQAGQMLDLMYEARGLGLAAPQVALPFQMIVVNVLADPQQKEAEHVFINPVLVEKSGGLVEGEEGCLSFPQLYQKVRRFRTATVQGYNLEGQAIELSAVDLEARLLQHELDHLQGVLFIDKMGPLAKLGARSALREFERVYQRAQERGEIPPDRELLRLLEKILEERNTPPGPTNGNVL